VVGLGVNVRQESFPDQLRDSATSLVAAGGRPPGRAWLLAATLSGFGARMGEPEKALEEYRALCDTLGRAVKVQRVNADPLEGTAIEVADSGALIVDTGDGTTHVAAGDVVHLRPG
jgi:BirA family biotin operon repressor/biotin-[acetyl-CoA-carboxylase] ligase